jgi:hypothetical protein
MKLNNLRCHNTSSYKSRLFRTYRNIFLIPSRGKKFFRISKQKDMLRNPFIPSWTGIWASSLEGKRMGREYMYDHPLPSYAEFKNKGSYNSLHIFHGLNSDNFVLLLHLSSGHRTCRPKIFWTGIQNWIKQSPSETASWKCSQKITCILYKSNGSFLCWQKPAILLSVINPVHALAYLFFATHVNIALTCKPIRTSVFLP